MSSETYVVGSIVWFANGTMATQRLAVGGKAACEGYAGAAEHPLLPDDKLHPERLPRMLVVTETEWAKLLRDADAADGTTVQ